MKKWLLWLCVPVLCVGVVRADVEAEEEEYEDFAEEMEILDQTVRLDFKLVPMEEGDQGVFVLTAAPWYATALRFESEDTMIGFHMSGMVQILEEDRLFVSYEGHVEYAGDDEEAEFHVDASVLLKPGENVKAASMGDKTLMIRASYVDADEE